MSVCRCISVHLYRCLRCQYFGVHTDTDPFLASAEWWSIFDRIRDDEGKIVGFVRCHRCFSLLTYDSKKTGTSSLSTHAKGCRAPLPNRVLQSASTLPNG